MAEQINFKEEWGKTKKTLDCFSRQVSNLLETGEKEAIKLSKKSKLHIDSATLTLKIEQLCYLIGKEYLNHLGGKSKSSKKLQSLVKQAKEIHKEQIVIENSLSKIK